MGMSAFGVEDSRLFDVSKGIRSELGEKIVNFKPGSLGRKLVTPSGNLTTAGTITAGVAGVGVGSAIGLPIHAARIRRQKAREAAGG